jgi:hypothetical protein
MPLYIYKWKSFCDFLWNCREAAKLRYELEMLTKHDVLLLMPEGAQYLGSLGSVSFRDTAIQSVLVLCIRDTKRGGSENQTRRHCLAGDVDKLEGRAVACCCFHLGRVHQMSGQRRAMLSIPQVALKCRVSFR